MTDSKSPIPPSKSAWRATIWLCLLAGFLAALLDVATGAHRLLGAWSQIRTATVDVFGTVHVASFSEVGDYVSVGCEQSASTTTKGVLPKGAYEVQAKCDWRDTDHLKSQNCIADRDSGTTRARGSIRGRDTEFFNCSGGGKGRLRVYGTYKFKTLGKTA